MVKGKHSALRFDTRSAGLRTVAERKSIGRARREQFPRSLLAGVAPLSVQRNPLAVLHCDDAGRLPDLLRIRYGRMLASPFAFLRGAVAVMMEDIGRLPHSGITTRLCGDCHIRNFGAFASPGQPLLFGINDFDQTLEGPFEWDVKRLAASITVAAREQGISDRKSAAASVAAAGSYRRHMTVFSRMQTMDVWNFGIAATALVDLAAGDRDTRRKREAMIEKAASRTYAGTFRKLTIETAGLRRIRDQPPFIYHLDDVARFEKEVQSFLHRYRATLPDERRALLDRFRLADVAAKVIGVGSVGLRCAIALLVGGADQGLFLQLKEVRPSVLQRYAGGANSRNQGLRVVTGQQLMQAAPDPFLGWFREPDLKTDFYVRQYSDSKFSVDSADFSANDFVDYAQLCGWELARAHARAGDAAMISGYVGSGDGFDKAIGRFASAYADRTTSDHHLLVEAVHAGKIQATLED